VVNGFNTIGKISGVNMTIECGLWGNKSTPTITCTLICVYIMMCLILKIVSLNTNAFVVTKKKIYFF